MAKFAIECPKCGSVNTASTFVLAKKVIQCGTCGEEINIKQSRLTSKVCPHCGKVFVYDQAKTKNKRCPSCGETIDAAKAATAAYKMVTVNCPQCACAIEVDKTKETATCPICDCTFDVNKELAKSKLVSDTGVSVIQYEGDNSVFVWKHPIEDFNLGSQLIVHESQEAIFFLNGEALDCFGPGRHTLETENMPVLKKLYSLPTGTQSPFHAEVYFINKTVQMGLKWGTDTRVRFIDPVTGLPLDIGASGELNLQVSDSRKLLVKLVGTTGGLTNRQLLSSVPTGTDNTVQRTLQGFFRAPLMTEIKSYLASTIREKKLNILEIDEHLRELSDALRICVSPKFEEYGLIIPQFYVTTISLPEDDPNFKKYRELISVAYLRVKEEQVRADIAKAEKERKIIEQQTEAELKVIQAQGDAAATRTTGFAEAEVMAAKGYTQKDLIEADVQKAYAEGMGKLGGNGGNGGGGGEAANLLNTVVQFGFAKSMMDKMDGVVGRPGGETAQNVPSSVPPAATWTCVCGERGNTKKFCMNCGRPKPEPSAAWDCPSCGFKGITSKFCPECGAKKPEPPAAWDCPSCGFKGITSKFCPECGAKKPEAPAAWDCPSCGLKGITGKFCPDCGAKKPENDTNGGE